MKIGYARVSTADQSLNRQIDMLKETGCEKIFEEKVTGTKRERPELMKMLEQLRKDDVVVVTDLTRLSRSTRDLFEIVEQIQQKGANAKSLKEAWLDTTSSTGKLMFTIFAGLAQFERDLIADRTKEGLASAKSRGKKLGRPTKYEDKKQIVLDMYNSGNHSIKDIITATEISKSTLFRIINASK